MQTSNGLNIDEKGAVKAVSEETGEETTVRWGKIDDPEAGDYQQTLGIENGTWVENGSDDNGNYYLYRIDGETYRIYQNDLNQPG